jgi:hypothetical protein
VLPVFNVAPKTVDAARVGHLAFSKYFLQKKLPTLNPRPKIAGPTAISTRPAQAIFIYG